MQSCQDARRAYRNFFDSHSGKRKGHKIGHPRFKTRKDNRQSIRLTRNGFGVTDRGVRVAKVGNIRLEWSRPLPSIPFSVTIIQEADGRYYASFVIEAANTPLPPSRHDVGIDLGLDRLAVTSYGEVIANPRHLRVKVRKLARVERVKSRRQKGSANRDKVRIRVAVAHRKVRETRLDAHHNLALRLVRDNQAIYVEDLNIAGMVRSNLAKSLSDAGLSTFVRVLREKAERYGRTVVKVSRWFPSSQLCSTCGHRDRPKPLKVRAWTCVECGAAHDRDMNAAHNILVEGRKIAAGLAEIPNACGGDVRREFALAVADEAGTHRGAA